MAKQKEMQMRILFSRGSSFAKNEYSE